MPEVQDQAPGNWGRIELAGTPARWMVLPHPGGRSRPTLPLDLEWYRRPDQRTDSNRSARLAIVTMDLSRHAAMQRHLAGLASTVALGPDHVDAGDGADGAPGWTMLFDGTSLEHFRGFKKQTMPGGWEIVDGNLTLTGSGGDIITREQYDNFEFELQWRVEEGGNSGIFFNVTEDKDYVWQTGPEMQILDDERHQDGKNPLTSAGSNYGLHAPAGCRPARRTVEHGPDPRVRERRDLLAQRCGGRLLHPAFKSLGQAGLRQQVQRDARLRSTRPRAHRACRIMVTWCPIATSGSAIWASSIPPLGE